MKVLETAPVVVDCLVYDRGDDQSPRFITILDDMNYNFVDDFGHVSDDMKPVIYSALQIQAIKQGATKIPLSYCISTEGLTEDMINDISNDSIDAFDEDSRLWISDTHPLHQYLIKEKLVLNNEELIVNENDLDKVESIILDRVYHLLTIYDDFINEEFITRIVRYYTTMNRLTKERTRRIINEVLENTK